VWRKKGSKFRKAERKRRRKGRIVAGMKRKGEKKPVGRLNENNKRRRCSGKFLQTKMNIQ
jgi:hypothetical protein